MDGTTLDLDKGPQDIAVPPSSFEKLRRNNRVYVDKTALIHEIFLHGEEQYFLARPPGFGKSLLVSVLKAIFEGRRELFRGLAIDSLGYHWKKYPVIHLDLGNALAKDAAELEAILDDQLEANAKANGVHLRQGPTAGLRFEGLIKEVAEAFPDRGVVVLVDDYDKPLLRHLWRSDAARIGDLLKSFYYVIKGTEGIQHFALLTGVTRFSMASEFSGLNNLNNLTMDARAATLLGYTRAELRGSFGGHVEAFAAANGLTAEAAYAELEEWCGGYRFEEKSETVSDPVSVRLCLADRRLRNHWYETRTPAFLLELLRRQPLGLPEITASGSDFSVYEADKPLLLPLLVQSGYLTIKGFEKKKNGRRIFTLGFPNRQVAESFDESLVAGFCQVREDRGSRLARIRAALRDGDIDGLLGTLRDLLPGIPRGLVVREERFHQMVFHAIMRLAGGDVLPEMRSGIGWFDAALKTEKRILVLGFRLDGTAEEALAGIREKQYCGKHSGDGRELVRVGVELDPGTGNLGRWLAERVPA